MAALVLAALLGYAWMGEGGAAAFALAGLWGSYGAARKWTMGRGMLVVVAALATLVPALLWGAALLRPELADTLCAALEPSIERMLAYTLADGRAYYVLLEQGRLSQFPALRLGIAACWLCALPAAAAIVLWYGEVAVEKHWYRDRERSDPMVLLFGGLGTGTLSTVLLMGGVGFGPGTSSLALGLGALMYPLVFLVWLCSIAALRAWANWWFVAHAPGKAPPP
ncbi:MAG: hypothetical protein ACM31D_04250 [Bacteroidota bacterium]